MFHTRVADTSETILGFVAAGLGYSIVPSILLGGPHEVGVHASPLTRPVVEFPIYAVWRRSAARHPLIDAALATAQSVIARSRDHFLHVSFSYECGAF